MKAILMLEDGKSFSAEALGSSGERIGRACFNTAVVGYQEMMTDPANAGKVLVLTYPLIGNYGCAPKFNESDRAWLAALVIKESSRIYSNWQAKESLEAFAKKEKVFILTGADTRSIAIHLRNKGEMLGIVSTEEFDPKKLAAKLDAYKKAKQPSLIQSVSVQSPTLKARGKKKIAVLDLGTTNGLIKQLSALNVSVTLLPYLTDAASVLRSKPAGLIISGGPEEDAAFDDIVANIKPLLGKIPILGISTGHQVLASALGGRINRMKLGHRGVNYPVRRHASYKGEITTQNHASVVDANSLGALKGVTITGYNLNDMSVEEIESKKYKCLGVQYCPVSPGLDEVNPVLIKFMHMVNKE